MFTNLKSYHYIGLGSAAGFVCTILFGFILMDSIMHAVVGNQKALKKGNEMRDIYLKLPVPLDFRVYFFNISNPEHVRNGSNPIVQEIGPFCYDAYKEKINITEDQKSDVLTYTPYDTYFFNKTRSENHHQDDYVTILHPLILALIGTVAREQPRFLSVLNKALPAIFQEKNDIYLTAKVRDILFDGVVVNCTTKDFSGAAVCSQFRGVDSLIEIEPGIYKFSLLGTRNGTSSQRISVLRGIKKASDVGRVVAINNQSSLEQYPEAPCSELRGTDGWIFPSFLAKEEGIWSVSVDLCRSIKAAYEQEEKYRGLSVRKYTANFGNPANNSDEQCYCPAPDKCLPRGVIDVSRCMKAPIYCTLPHFLDVDESVAAKVGGLLPEREKHVVKILFEPFTGTPVVGMRRIQFNMKLEPLPKIAIMKNVPDVIHPMLWLQEGIELDGMLLSKVTDAFLLLNIFNVMKYLFLVANVAGIAFSCYKIYVERKNCQVMAVTSAKESGTSSADKSISMVEVKN